MSRASHFGTLMMARVLGACSKSKETLPSSPSLSLILRNNATIGA